jgi:hypothetical protein
MATWSGWDISGLTPDRLGATSGLARCRYKVSRGGTFEADPPRVKAWGVGLYWPSQNAPAAF